MEIGTESGRWIKQTKRRRHEGGECSLPVMSDHIGAGSKWRCGCGQRWMLERVINGSATWRKVRW